MCHSKLTANVVSASFQHVQCIWAITLKHALAYNLIFPTSRCCVKTGILGEAGEIEGVAGEAEEGVDTSLTLADMAAQALTGLQGHAITMSDPLLACPHLRCLLNTLSHSIRKSMTATMTRGVHMRSPISMHHKHMMRPMVFMVPQLVLLLLGRVSMVNTALKVDSSCFCCCVYTPQIECH